MFYKGNQNLDNEACKQVCKCDLGDQDFKSNKRLYYFTLKTT